MYANIVYDYRYNTPLFEQKECKGIVFQLFCWYRSLGALKEIRFNIHAPKKQHKITFKPQVGSKHKMAQFYD